MAVTTGYTNQTIGGIKVFQFDIIERPGY